jgi:hypothetical protein
MAKSATSVLSVSLWWFSFVRKITTEAQRAQRAQRLTFGPAESNVPPFSMLVPRCNQVIFKLGAQLSRPVVKPRSPKEETRWKPSLLQISKMIIH